VQAKRDTGIQLCFCGKKSGAGVREIENLSGSNKMTEIIFDKDEDWGKRILCSDESCIGTIGPDGKCRECGKHYEGEILSGQGASSDQAVTAEEQKPVSSTTHMDSDDDWDKRVLCSDESCIGTIGSDGKCTECGKLGK
jgi:hypothetical protein